MKTSGKSISGMVAQLLRYLDTVEEELEELEKAKPENPYVGRRIKYLAEVGYFEVKKLVRGILAETGGQGPLDPGNPAEYFKNVRRWCIGHLWWEDGTPVGDETQELRPAEAEKPAETKQKKKGSVRKILKWFVGIIGTIIVGIIVTVITDILGDFGWIERIKTIVHNILTCR
jgi:hypothetical protein